MRRLLALFLLAALSGLALAKPASWYKWRSKVTGKFVCSQSSPGHGWNKEAGPYRDARCEVPGKR